MLLERYTWVFAMCLSLARAHGSTCTTVSSGDIADLSIWDCGCEPSICDTLFILHDCYTVGSRVFANGLVEISPTGSLASGDTLTFTGRFTNHGTVNVHRLVKPSFTPTWKNTGSVESGVLWLWGDSALNTGTVRAVDTLNIGTYTRFESHGYVHGDFLWSGGYENYDTVMFNRCQSDLLLANAGFFQITGLFINLLVVSNEIGGVLRADTLLSYGRVDNLNLMQIDHLLQFGTQQASQGELEVFPSSARIDCGNLKNYGTMKGAGDICVQDSSINYATGSITGSPDICDASLSTTTAPFLDVNLGTIDNAVHWCPNTNCSNAITGPSDQANQLMLYPVPAYTNCTVQTPEATNVALFEVLNTQGARHNLPFGLENNAIVVDLTGLPAGVYVCRIVSKDLRSLGTTRLIVSGP